MDRTKPTLHEFVNCFRIIALKRPLVDAISLIPARGLSIALKPLNGLPQPVIQLVGNLRVKIKVNSALAFHYNPTHFEALPKSSPRAAIVQDYDLTVRPLRKLTPLERDALIDRLGLADYLGGSGL